MPKLFKSYPGQLTQETSAQASDLPLPTWRVKLANGAVYGPIELGELQTWAAECRLAPGDQVSSDTSNWTNAETLPELKMQWMVEMVSGEIFGPVHLHAIVDFALSRLVLPSSRITNRVTGKTSTVAELVLPLIPGPARNELLAAAPGGTDQAASDDRLIKFTRNISAARLPPDQHQETLQRRIEQLQTTVAESEWRIKQLQSDLDAQQAQTIKLHESKAALEKTCLDAQRNYESAAQALKTAEAQVQALRAAQGNREQELGARLNSLFVQVQDISGQLAEKNSALGRLETELAEARRNFEADMRSLQDRLGRATSDYDSASNALREKELSLNTAERERDLAVQAAQALQDRYAASMQELDAQMAELVGQQQAAGHEIKMRQTQIEQLQAALAEKEQFWVNAAREWDSIRSDNEGRIQALTGQIGALTAEQEALRSKLEQSRAELEQTRRETRQPASLAKELNKRMAMFNRELETVRGELSGREPELKRQPERAAGGEPSAPAAAQEAQPQSRSPSPGPPEQPARAEAEDQRPETPRAPAEAKLERAAPGYPEITSPLPPLPDDRRSNRTAEKNVLIVVDSEVIQQLITKLAEKYGASVTAVTSARDVAGILAQKACRFDLFVLDLILPEITGWELLGTLRARPETKDTPIIILAGPLSPKEKDKILQKANAVIEKSEFTLMDFNKLLSQWL